MSEIPIEPDSSFPTVVIRSSKLTRELTCRESIFAAYDFNSMENTFTFRLSN